MLLAIKTLKNEKPSNTFRVNKVGENLGHLHPVSGKGLWAQRTDYITSVGRKMGHVGIKRKKKSD